MQARMNVAKAAEAGYRGMLDIGKFLRSSSLPESILHLVELRVSQINGCAYCVNMHSNEARKAGVSDEQLFTVAAWRESPYFSDEERAALAVAEAATRIADNPDGVPDDVWNDAAGLFEEQALAALVMAVATINAWNRINVTIRQPAA